MNGCDCACHHGYGNAHNEQTCRCKPGGEGYRSVDEAEAVEMAQAVARSNKQPEEEVVPFSRRGAVEKYRRWRVARMMERESRSRTR